MKKIFLSLALMFNWANAEELSLSEAEKILDNASALYSYVGLDIKSDDDVIKKTLFGLFAAKTKLEYEEKGENSVIFSLGGKSVLGSDLISSDKNPEFFKKVPKAKTQWGDAEYNFAVSKEILEISVPYFTGYKIKNHKNPQAEKNDAFYYYFDQKNYYLLVDGLGDDGLTWKLEKVVPNGEDFILSGEVKDEFKEDEKTAKKPFSMKISKGEVANTWKIVEFKF